MRFCKVCGAHAPVKSLNREDVKKWMIAHTKKHHKNFNKMKYWTELFSER